MSKNATRASSSPDLVPMEEEAPVIQRLQTGDKTAFSILYGWYGDPLYRQVILPRLPNRELAEDCLRDTFRVALEKIGTFEHKVSVFFWLRRIAINKAMDAHRRRRRDHDLRQAVRHDPTTSASTDPPPDRGLEVQDIHRDVHLSLSRLNERYATALRLRLIEGRSREECAATLDVTVGNFDVILHRAAKAFRKVYPP